MTNVRQLLLFGDVLAFLALYALLLAGGLLLAMAFVRPRLVRLLEPALATQGDE